MTDPDAHTLVGAYALDAVDDIERARFDRHLAQCPACALEVAELRATSARLADLSATAAPPGLRDTVLARIRQTPQVGPGRGAATPTGARPRWRQWALAAAVLGVVAAGVGVTTFELQEQRVRQATDQAGQANRIAAVLGAPDARVHTATVDGGRVTVVTSAALNQGVATLAGLPVPAAGHSYQLWLVPPGAQPINTGVIRAGSQRYLLRDLRGATTFAVSTEDSVGAVATPGPPVWSTPV